MALGVLVLPLTLLGQTSPVTLAGDIGNLLHHHVTGPGVVSSFGGTVYPTDIPLPGGALAKINGACSNEADISIGTTFYVAGDHLGCDGEPNNIDEFTKHYQEAIQDSVTGKWKLVDTTALPSAPPPPPAPCSYIAGTNNEYTAGCVASPSCVLQPDGFFMGNCSAVVQLPSCIANATTLCLDDKPNDKRFQISVQYNTTEGGGSFGAGQAIALGTDGVTQGGLFWLFSSSNPEILVKVLDACSVNNHIWVFASGTTNVGLDLTVLDTTTKFSQTYINPDVHAMDTVQDTTTFPCSN